MSDISSLVERSVCGHGLEADFAVAELCSRPWESIEQAIWPLLGSPDRRCRIVAFTILGQARMSPEASLQASKVLFRTVSAGPPDEAAEALLAMCQRGVSDLDAAEVRAIRELAHSPHPRVRQALATGAAKAPDGPLFDALLTLAEDSDAEVRNWACFGLRSTPTPLQTLASEVLASRLVDEDETVRFEAGMSLVSLGALASIPDHTLVFLATWNPESLTEVWAAIRTLPRPRAESLRHQIGKRVSRSSEPEWRQAWDAIESVAGVNPTVETPGA